MNKGLAWVLANVDTYHITSVSISQGSITQTCTPNNANSILVKQLKDKGVPVIYPAGNDGVYTKVDFPACNTDAITVGGLDKTPESNALPYTPGLPWRNSNYSSEIDFWALAKWKSVYPGGTFTITQGTSDSAAAVNGYWALLKQAKPTATYQEIFDAIAASGSKFSTEIVQSGYRIEIKAAAELLAGGPVNIIDGTPYGVPQSTIVTADDGSVVPSIIPPVISAGKVSSTDKAWPEGNVYISATATDDTALSRFDIFFQDSKGNRKIIATPIVNMTAPKTCSFNDAVNVPSDAIVGDTYTVIAKAYDADTSTEMEIGSFTILKTPADTTRPTTNVVTFAKQQVPQAPGAGIYVSLNVRDDIKVLGAKYSVTDPSGKTTIYTGTFNSGSLFTMRSYFDTWKVPTNAVDSATYVIKGWGYDAIGDGPVVPVITVTVTNPPKATPTPVATPTPTPVATPTPTPVATPTPTPVATPTPTPVATPTPTPVSMPVVKKLQTISFPEPAAFRESGPGLKLIATSSSGLPVTFTTTTPKNCQILNLNPGFSVQQVYPTSGADYIPCSVTASQAGDANYLPAPSMTWTFNWIKQITKIDLQTSGSIGTAPYQIKAFYRTVDPNLMSGLVGLGANFTIASMTPSICSTSQVSVLSTTLGTTNGFTVTPIKNGLCTIVLNVAASSERNGASVTWNGNITSFPTISSTKIVTIATGSMVIGGIDKGAINLNAYAVTVDPTRMNGQSSIESAVTMTSMTPTVCKVGLPRLSVGGALTVTQSTISPQTKGNCNIRITYAGNSAMMFLPSTYDWISVVS
jgi:hypothetical protein